MAGVRGGIHNYSVQEAQNVTLGQSGALLTNDTSNDMDAPTGSSWVAIQIIDDATFTTLTQESNRWYGSAAGASDLDSNGDTTFGITFPSGMTIYGRWSKFNLAGGTVIAYVG